MAKVIIENTEAFFVNPFHYGIDYKMFTDALKGKSVKDYCKGHLTEDQIEWLENDLNIYKENLKNK